MNISKSAFIKIEANGCTIVTLSDSNTALFFNEYDEFLGTLFGSTLEQLKDIALFMEYSPNSPNRQLCRKYNITPGDNLFRGNASSSWEAWFDKLEHLGVIKKNQIFEFYDAYSLEKAFRDFLY